MAYNARSRTDMAGRLIWYSGVSPYPTIQAFASLQVFDDFKGLAIDATNDWNVSVDAGAVAYLATTDGAARMTPAAADNDTSELCGGLVFIGAKAPCVEMRIAIEDVSTSAMFMGFADATAYGAGLLPVSYNGGAIGPNATDCIGMLWDADNVGGTVRMIAYQATVEMLDAATTVAPADQAWHVYRVETDPLGSARFYIDGQWVGGGTLLISDAVPLSAYVGLSGRTGVAATDYLTIDYIRAWQSR